MLGIIPSPTDVSRVAEAKAGSAVFVWNVMLSRLERQWRTVAFVLVSLRKMVVKAWNKGSERLLPLNSLLACDAVRADL